MISTLLVGCARTVPVTLLLRCIPGFSSTKATSAPTCAPPLAGLRENTTLPICAPLLKAALGAEPTCPAVRIPCELAHLAEDPQVPTLGAIIMSPVATCNSGVGTPTANTSAVNIASISADPPNSV